MKQKFEGEISKRGDYAVNVSTSRVTPVTTGWLDPPVNFLGIHTHGHQHQKSFLLNIVSNAR